LEIAGVFYAQLENITGVWYILWHFADIAVFWCIFPCFGILYQDKSGNPVRWQQSCTVAAVTFGSQHN
jgi:hypothetical protein